jgi:Sec-independent protein secretion pathway component TatC|tara:strand:+ start:303 stop:473 length:171 start_codon:yes stop_codon:yes gene_type:complete
MAEDIRTKVSIELALSYVALAVSFFAALFAIIPVFVWLGAAGIARKLLDEHQKKTF